MVKLELHNYCNDCYDRLVSLERASAVRKSNQIKFIFSVAGNNNTQYKSIHLRLWQFATEGMDGQTDWH